MISFGFARRYKKILKKIRRIFDYEIVRTTPQWKGFISTNRSFSFYEIIGNSIRNNKNEGAIIIIGAHDLLSHDSIIELLKENFGETKIVCFEPRVNQYISLEKNIKTYGIKNAIPINSAVSPSGEDIYIYDVDEKYLDEYPLWVNGIASVYIDHLLRSVKKEHIKKYIVKCSNPDSWHQDFDINRIRYLQIDTEGYDFEILKSINLDFFRPDIIKMEFCNLSDIDKFNATKYLADHSYDIYFDGEDLLAVHFMEII